MSWWSSDARIVNCLTLLSNSMLSLTVRLGWNAIGLLLRGVKVGLGIRPRNIASSCCREDQVCFSLKDAWCEQKNAELVYGGGLGGGGGDRVGQEVVLRVTGGERSIDGAGDDDEGLWLADVRWVAVCCKTWARLVVLISEGDSWESGSTPWARLIGCRLCDLLRFRIRISRRWGLWSKLLSIYCVLVELYSLSLFSDPDFS